MMFFRHRYIALILTGCLAATLPGCGEGSSKTASPNASKKSSTKSTDEDDCRRRLASGIRKLNPQTLAFANRPEKSISGLNSWISRCQGEVIKELQLSEDVLKLLPDPEKATARRFPVTDAEFIRDAILLRDLTNQISERAQRDGKKVAGSELDVLVTTSVFDWVMNNIRIPAAGDPALPVNLFDMLLRGEGTLQDRAWILSEALRQQQLDSVVLETSAEAADGGGLLESSNLLLVVFAGEEVLVLDPRLGRLEPGKELLTALKENARWKSATPQIVGRPSLFSPRMMLLQQNLAADDAAVVFEELGSEISRKQPMPVRIEKSSGGLFKSADLAIWSHPNDREAAAAQRSDEDQKAFALMMRSFDAPFERKDLTLQKFDDLPANLSKAEKAQMAEQVVIANFNRMMEGDSEDKFGEPSRRLLKARLEQISGSSEEALIQQYQQVRSAAITKSILIKLPQQLQQGRGPVAEFPLPKLIQDVNSSAMGDAMYWTGVCQLDRGLYRAAPLTFLNYRRMNPDGRWKYPSFVLQALAKHKDGQVDKAIEILKQADKDDNPEQARVKRMLQEWTPEGEDK